QRSKEAARAFRVEAWRVSPEAQEEAVTRREVEVRRVEERMAKPRQAVAHDHADDRGERGEEHRSLEGYRDELGPAVQGPPARIDGIGDHRRVPLEEIAAGAP